jgi:uncharacterized protein YjiS (DUF1127 family)
MTFLNDTSNFSGTSAAIRKALGYFARRAGRLISNWIAARIAHREYQANLALLRTLSDRELRDMGLDRCQIGEGLAEAAKARSCCQQSWHRDSVNSIDPNHYR